MSDILLPLSKEEAEALMFYILEHDATLGQLLKRLEDLLRAFEDSQEKDE